MKKITLLAMTLALVLGIAGSSFAGTNSTEKTHNTKGTTSKVKGVEKPKKHHKQPKQKQHKPSVTKTKAKK